MLKPIKLTSPIHNTWFTSDLHIGHNRSWIVGARGFKTIEEHDNTLIHRWNEVCSHQSVVFHLGDLCFNDSDGKRCRDLIRRLSFSTLYLMLGNHIGGHLTVYKDLLREAHPWAFDGDSLIQEVYPFEWLPDGGTKRVIFLPEYVEVIGGSEHLVLCHYPLISHHKISKGSIMLSGHCHGNLSLTHRDTGCGNRLDVGVDTFGRPINLAEIRGILRGRPIDAKDHHGEGETSGGV